jgi:hypothetical protein
MPLLTDLAPRRTLIIGAFLAAGATLGFAIAPKAMHNLLPAHLACEQVAGTWTFGELRPEGATLRSTLTLTQNGHTFTGKGLDAEGQFTISDGSIEGNQISFTKDYSGDRQNSAKQQIFKGNVDWVNPEPQTSNTPYLAHAFGTNEFQCRQGYGWHLKCVSITSKWEGGLLTRP